ncbi:domain found in IF2B/IF5-domain-containing protein [Phlyctochytrium arcticum]|nr:domain found in IF2B/IF5-domain-containing protein [Phlyctochytrium arcticum]
MSSGNINIRRDVSDKFYRYKMPKLQAKIEGKGNGIKTVVPNMSLIAKSLSRPATYTTKFFGCELGAQVNCDEKNDRYVVNGAHEASRMQELLDGFIDRFVLCNSCKNPETDLSINKDDFILKNCKACGAVSTVDMRHKLTTYILKNPPAQAKKSKKSKKDGKKGMPTPPDTASNGSDEDGADDDVTRAMDAEAAAMLAAPIEDLARDDDDWAVDTSADAVARRMKELAVGGAVAKLDAEADDDESDDPLEQFADYITANPKATDDEIQNAANNLDIRADKACVVLAQVLFNENILTEKQVHSRAPLLKKFSKNEKAQKGLLGGIERLIGVSANGLMSKVPIVLKALYDEDLVDEEVFLAWGEKPSKKFVDRKVSKEIREKAAPFLDWLKEADEEESDEEESE